MNKKLTPHQFSDLAKKLPEVHSQSSELAELIKSKPQKVQQVLGEYYSWSEIYELSFVEQLAYLFVLLDMQKPILEIAASTAPQQALILASENGGKLDQWYELNKDNIEKKQLLWLVVVLQRNILRHKLKLFNF